jgi:hypothetical protein
MCTPVGGEATVQAALDRLTTVLPAQAPAVWESLRPSAGQAALDVVRQAIAPYELPSEICALWQWADGQERGAPWWPAIECGPLLCSADAADHYKWLGHNAEPAQWCSFWLPIAHDGWNQAAVEIAPDGPGVVIDASFPDAPRVIAPTLAVMLDVTAEMVEAVDGAPPEDSDAREWRARRDAILDNRPEWIHWPYHRAITSDSAWPEHWRRAARL